MIQPDSSINYSQKFDGWVKQSGFESVLNCYSEDSPFYKILNPDFAKILNDSVLSIEILNRFLEEEGENDEKDKSRRESVLYCAITAVANSQCPNGTKQIVGEWIQKIGNLASLFDFSNDHCFLFSLVYTLETQVNDDSNKLILFTKRKDDIFKHIIQDVDLLPSDSQIDNKKNILIYYLFHLIVKLKNYKAAYQFYNGFIGNDVEDTEAQIDIIETLTSECSLVTAFNFIRKSGEAKIENKLKAMINIANQKKKINEFVHLPFNSNEKDIIRKLESIDFPEFEQFYEFQKLFDDVRK